MVSRQDQRPTLADKLAVAGCIAAVIPLLIFWPVAWCLSRRAQLPFGKQMFANLEGFFTKSLTIRQLRILVPVEPAEQALAGYARRARRLGLANFNREFSGSARWIHEVQGRGPADPVLLYIHGGGYALTAAAPQIEYMLELSARYARHASTLLFDYSVTPAARYPAQLEELVALYRDLLATTSEIHIIGDSCGCHLAIQLCMHSATPGAGTASLQSLVFFSPWCCLDVSRGGSYDRYEEWDILDKASSKEMQSMYCDDAALLDPKINPFLETRREYWQKVLPEKVVVVYGEYEILGDGIRQWCASAGITPYMERAGVHDAMLLGFGGGSTERVCAELDAWLAPARAPARAPTK